MTDEHKVWIDKSSYEDLLSKWRYGAMGDSLFMGDTGDYFKSVMAEKRGQLGTHSSVISKRVGWPS